MLFNTPQYMGLPQPRCWGTKTRKPWDNGCNTNFSVTWWEQGPLPLGQVLPGSLLCVHQEPSYGLEGSLGSPTETQVQTWAPSSTCGGTLGLSFPIWEMDVKVLVFLGCWTIIGPDPYHTTSTTKASTPRALTADPWGREKTPGLHWESRPCRSSGQGPLHPRDVSGDFWEGLTLNPTTALAYK